MVCIVINSIEVSMFKIFGSVLSTEKISKIKDNAIGAVKAGDTEKAWNCLQPLLKIQPQQVEAAEAILTIVEENQFLADKNLQLLSAVVDAHDDNIELISRVGSCLEEASEINFLNRSAPDDPLFETIVDKLTCAFEKTDQLEHETALCQGLATAARMMARQKDSIAERAYKRLIELAPDKSSQHYGYGLFLKTRGRFEEGMRVNQKAVSLETEPVESYEWNLGICATGAGHGEIALDVWKRMGQKIGHWC